MVFLLLRVNDTLGDVCEIWEDLHSFRELKCDQNYSKALWMGLQDLKNLFISGWT